MRVNALKIVVVFALLLLGVATNSFAQIGISPIQQKVCTNDSTTIRLSNIVFANSTFVWQDSSAIGWSTISASSVYSGINNDTLFIKNITSLLNNRKYRCIVDSSGAGIRKDTVGLSLLQVRAALSIPLLSASQNICFGNTPDTIKIIQLPTGGDSGFSYQWQKSSNAIAWQNLTAQTNSFLTVDTFQTSTYFRVVATSLSGCGIVNSASVFVQFFTKLIPGHVISGITHYKECYLGNPDSIAVGINTGPSGGNGLFHNQWQMSTDTVNWVDLINDTTENKSSVQSITTNVCYRLKSTSYVGCGVVYSDTIYVSVLSPVIKPTIFGAQTICFNEDPDTLYILTSNQLGNDVTHQWQSSINGNTWVDIAGKTTKELILPKNGVTKFYRVKTTWANCAIRFTDSILVSVYQNLNAGTIKSAQNICYNTTPAALSFQTLPSGGGDSFTYQWQLSSDSVNFIDIPGANALLYPPSTLTSTKFYRVKVISAFGCGFVFTNIIRVKVYPPFVGTDISANDTICFNTSPDTLRALVNPTGGNGTYLFQWQVSTNGNTWTNVSGQSTKKYKPSDITSTTHYRLISFSGASCGIDTSNTITIKVWPNITKARITSHQSVCFNTPADTLRVTQFAQGGNSKFNYQWQISNDGTIWNNINGQTSLKLFTGNLTSTKFYRIVATSIFGCGSIASDSVRIFVYNQLIPAVISENQTVCFDSIPTSLYITTKPTGANDQYTYQWQVSTDSVNFTDIPFATDTLLQMNNHTSNRYYRLRINSVFGCASVLTNIIRVKVYKKFEGAEIGTTAEVCYGDVPATLHMTIMPKGGSLTYTYQWQSSVDSANWGDMIGHTADTLLMTPLYRTTHFRLINSSTFSCGIDTSNVITIYSLKLPDTTRINGLNEVCKNQQELYYNLENKSSDYTYEWFITKGNILTNETKTNVFITWGELSGNDTIIVKQTNKENGCFNLMKLPILIKETQAPNITQIIRKSSTNILVCKDSTNGLQYQWGYINKQTKEVVEIQSASLRYVQLPHTFDTTLYIYFVRTFFDDCKTTSYYNFNALSLGIQKGKNDIVKVFPNPTQSSFKVMGIDISEAIITCSDIIGNNIPIEKIEGKNEFQFMLNQASGIYIVNINTPNGIYFERIILSR